MSAKSNILTGAAGLAALVGMAAPAAAQYYPQPGYGNGYGYPNQGNVVSQVISNVLGYGRYPYGNYGYNTYSNQSVAIDQCARAVEARLGGANGYYGYGSQAYNQGYNRNYGYANQGYNRNYGYNQPYANNRYAYNQGYAGGRVQGVTRVEQKSYGLKVWGVASSGNSGYSGYNQGYGTYGYSNGADLKWDCEVNRDGRIR